MDNILEDIQYHRNGVGGEGFHVVTFQTRESTAEQYLPFVGIVFGLDEEDSGETWNGRVAIFDRDLLGAGNITFGVNSWRGDRFESWLRQQIEEREAAMFG